MDFDFAAFPSENNLLKAVGDQFLYAPAPSEALLPPEMMAEITLPPPTEFNDLPIGDAPPMIIDHRHDDLSQFMATITNTQMPNSPDKLLPRQNMGGQISDEDSVCADIDRWASSSMEDSSSQILESMRVRELEEEQQRLSDSVLSLSTHCAQIQFRIQQINQAPVEKRAEMLEQLQEFASKSCIDLGQLKQDMHCVERDADRNPSKGQNATRKQSWQLIAQLRQQLEEVEKFAYASGQFPEGQLPLCELRARQKLILEQLREKLRFQIELEGPAESPDQFRKVVEKGLEQAMEPLREKDQLVGQLRTQIQDLERYVQLLQAEITSPPQSPDGRRNCENSSPATFQLTWPNQTDQGCAKSEANGDVRALESTFKQQKPGVKPGLIGRLFGCNAQRKKFERNELKHTPSCNHYGDHRAELELAVDAVVNTLQKHHILKVERPERDELPVEQLNESVFEWSQAEAVVSVVRKRFCPALRALLEHGLRDVVCPMPKGGVGPLSVLGIGCMSNRGTTQLNTKYLKSEVSKFDGYKLEHVWDVLQLFLEASRALEMRDAVIGNLSDAFKLDSVGGKTATSKQVLLCTIENVISSHSRLKRSPDSMWKAFVCAALNRNRLPAWIRIIFRSDLVLAKCYNNWSYVARTGCEDIRPLLEGLHQFNFDLPADLAVRPFEHIKEAF